jgi:uncharacterized protein
LPPSTELVIVDAGPLIALSRVMNLCLLPDIFGIAQTTSTVLAECTARPDRLEGVAIVNAINAGCLQICPEPVIAQDWDLGAGEASVIAAALAVSARVLMDDRAARKVATAQGLRVVGTMGVLVRAKQLGKMTRVRPLIEQLVASGYFLSASIIEEALLLVNE